jgi:hypothetical protein
VPEAKKSELFLPEAAPALANGRAAGSKLSGSTGGSIMMMMMMMVVGCALFRI